MEVLLYILVSIAVIAITINVTVISLAALIYIRTSFQDAGLDKWIPAGFIPNKPEVNSKNVYTPTDSVGSQIPLDQFTPNFDKPIKFKIAKDDTGSSFEEVPYEA